MHPISNKHFGDLEGSMRVSFHNGTEAVVGHIVRQIGTVRYVVSDGEVTKICQLAQTTAEAAALAEGQMTFYIDGKAIRKLEAFKATTTEGEQFKWSQADISAVGSEPEEEPEPEEEQVVDPE